MYRCVKNKNCKGDPDVDTKMKFSCFNHDNPSQTVQDTCCHEKDIIEDTSKDCSSLADHR